MLVPEPDVPALLKCNARPGVSLVRHSSAWGVMFQCLWCHVVGQVSHGQFLLLVVSYHQLLLLAYFVWVNISQACLGTFSSSMADQYNDAAIKDWQRRMVCCAGVFFPWLSCQVAALVRLQCLLCAWEGTSQSTYVTHRHVSLLGSTLV